MIKYILLVLFSMTLSIFSVENFYDLKAKKINGDTLNFSDLKGKKLMIVNVASFCGYTYQYAELQSLYKQYGGEHFEIIGFPANNFSNQEPGSDLDIIDFCTENYDVTFTMMSKISVVGMDKHPVYQWLTLKSKNGVVDQEVLWNFQKYLIDRNGKLVGIYGSNVSPLKQEIVNWVKDGISDVEENTFSGINIYPNPASEFLEINLETLTNSIKYPIREIRIINALGEIVSTETISTTNTNHRINLDNFPKGMYILQIGPIVQKFVKK